MKVRLLLLAATVLAGAGLGTQAVHAAPIDWVVATMNVTQTTTPQSIGGSGGSFEVGPGGSSKGPHLEVEAQGHSTKDHTTVLGSGVAFDGHGGTDVFDTADGGFHVQSTQTLGGLDLQVTKRGDVGFDMSSGAGAFATVHTISMVVFIANGVIDSFHVNATGGDTQVFTGSGSRAIGAADTAASGVAVDASVVAAGTSTVDVMSPLGLIGGPAIFECTHCSQSWTTSTGKTGSFDQTILPFFFIPLPVPLPLPPIPIGSISGDDGFVGPAGHWSWSWTGVNVRPEMSETIALGYAPIGDLWKLFVPSAPPIRVIAGPAPSSHHTTKVLAEKRTRKKLAATGVAASPLGWLFLASALGVAATLRRRPVLTR